MLFNYVCLRTSAIRLTNFDLKHFSLSVHLFLLILFMILANYYALKGMHEKAIVYFKRTLKLNRNYLAAWILLGHEYLELHNYRAALESYRTAVDIDQTDYRAWFGLGQVYEVLGLFPYAIYNYQKAILIR